MRQYLIDEMSPADIGKVTVYLNEHAETGGLDGLYWAVMEADWLEPDQRAAGRDFGFAVEVGDSWVKCEFLVRDRTELSSRLTRFATKEQQIRIIEFANRVIDRLGVRT